MRRESKPKHFDEVYRSFDDKYALTLISPDELELREGNTILLCKYSKQSDALRVVVTAMGTNQVIYFRFTNTGLQDNQGRVLLSPESYTSAMEQARIARQREENARREAERQQRQHFQELASQAQNAIDAGRWEEAQEKLRAALQLQADQKMTQLLEIVDEQVRQKQRIVDKQRERDRRISLLSQEIASLRQTADTDQRSGYVLDSCNSLGWIFASSRKFCLSRQI